MTEREKEHFVDQAIEELETFICAGEGDPLTALENLCRARSREIPREVYAVTEEAA